MVQTEFRGVTAIAKANVYFDGKVVSHTIVLGDGSRKTLGLIYPGAFHFGTKAAERMELIAGACRVKLDGTNSWNSYSAGQAFEVPANSGKNVERISRPLARFFALAIEDFRKASTARSALVRSSRSGAGPSGLIFNFSSPRR